MASWKWETALLAGTPLEEVLPARFGVDGRRDDWKNVEKRVADKDFVPLVNAAHPVTAGLDWTGAPPLSTAFKIVPKPGAQVLLQTPTGAPILAAWRHGGGRAIISSSIWANDQLSEKFGAWNKFGSSPRKCCRGSPPILARARLRPAMSPAR